MSQRYFAEPYQFRPPCRSTWFVNIAQWAEPIYFPLMLNVARMEFPGLERLQESLKSNQGILLACNHTSGCDPFVLGKLAQASGRWIHFIASYHLFRGTSELFGELIRRMGAYSIFREGPDLASMKATVELLRTGDRPILIFPEGTYFKQNDRIGPLQDGIGLILRQALRNEVRPIVLHPLAIKYWFRRDPLPHVRGVWTTLERRHGMEHGAGQSDLCRLERLIRLGMESMFADSRFGNEDEPLEHLIFQTVADQLERLTGDKESAGCSGADKSPTRDTLWAAIRKYRQTLVRELVEMAGNLRAQVPIQKKLTTLLQCENVLSISIDYAAEDPSWERIWETWARWEETAGDNESPFPAPVTAVVQVGPAIGLKKKDRARPGELTLDPAAADFNSSLHKAMSEQLAILCARAPVR